MPKPEIHLVPCLSDNYAVLFRLPGDDRAVLVDAPDAAPIRAALDRLGWALGTILVTHHHRDHVAGIPALAGADVAVIGPAAESDRIPGLTRTVAGGDRVVVAGTPVDVIATPGHTLGHVAYHLPEAGLLFSGDTLFAMGCGRLFEGTAADMWGSLGRLAALPDDTAVYCGHEYTLSNGRFALGIEPGNAELAARVAEVERLRAAGTPTVPTTLALEKRTNPFLRAADPAVAAGLGLSGAPAGEIFA
jgi:hydroxyacylglutathione hydrolase